MRIGVMFDTEQPYDDVVAQVAGLADAGIEAAWSSQIFAYDALTLLAAVSREVPSIHFGTAVVPTYPRHPVMLGAQALTVQAISGGRLTLGIGLTHQMVIENVFGMSFDKPVRHLREYLSVMMPLLEGQPVNFQGDDYKVIGGVSVPGSSRPAVVVAALGEQMLRVSAALADGTLTWCTGPATLRDHTVPTLRRAAEAAGRPDQRVIAALPVCVTSDTPAALVRAAKTFQMYGQLPSYRAMLDLEGAKGPEDIAIVGGAAEVADRIRALADVGVTDFAAVEFGGNPDEVAHTRAVVKSLL